MKNRFWWVAAIVMVGLGAVAVAVWGWAWTLVGAAQVVLGSLAVAVTVVAMGMLFLVPTRRWGDCMFRKVVWVLAALWGLAMGVGATWLQMQLADGMKGRGAAVVKE